MAMANAPLLAADTYTPGIQEIVEGGILAVPSSYSRPAHEPPQAAISYTDQIPILDLSGLLIGDEQQRLQTVREIGRACEEWGFFQVINHGVSQDVIDRTRAVGKAFFSQPAAERNRFRGGNLEAGVVYSTNPFSQEVRDWRDVLFVQDYPGKHNGFERLPKICKGAFQDYREGVKKLANLIYQAMIESLGLGSTYVQTAVPGLPCLVMSVNYYPPCPDPSLTFGVSGHSDVRSLTVLLQDDVPGLQIRKEDKWVAVKPLPNAFVINVGDQLQVLTNGIYRSVEHRVVTNAEKPRLSVVCFFGPKDETKIAPLSELVTENRPALYKEFVLGDYVRNFFSKGIQPNKGSLDFAKRVIWL